MGGHPAGPSGTGRPWRRRGLVLLIALAALSMYLYRIEAKSIWWDESLSLYRAQQDVPTILSGQIVYGGVASTDQHPPLYFLVLHATTRLLGDSDWALRFPSAICAVLLVPLLYAVGTRLRNAQAGVIAALIGAASPFVLWYAQEARMYTLVTFLGLLAFYSLWRAVVERRWAWGLGFGLSGSAALATQYLFAPVLAAQVGLGALLWLAVRPAGAGPLPRGWRPAPGVWAGIGVLGMAAALVGRQALGVMANPAIGREHVALIEMLRDTLNAFSLGATVDPASVLGLNFAFLAVFVAGAVSLWRRPPADLAKAGAAPSWAARLAGPLGLLAIVLAPVMAMWAYSLLIRPIYMGSRYVIMASPAFYLGLAVGAEALWRRRRLAGGLLVAGMVVAMGVSDVRYFSHPAYRTKEDHRSAARHVMAHEAAGDAILLTAPENITAFRHYYAGDLPVYPVPSVPLSGQQPPEVIEADLRAVLEQGYRRVWLVHCRTQFSDPEDAVTRWLDAHTLLLERTAYPSVGSWATVSAYRPTSPVQEGGPPAPALAVYEERLALEGADLAYRDTEGNMVDRTAASPPGAPPVPAGRSVTVSLTWRPLAPLGRYKVSLRLLDPQGIARAQVDRLPYMYLPTDEWPLGSVVRQEAYLRIPPGTPPGEYALQMVVYEEEDGRSLAVRRADAPEESHSLDIGTVAVARDEDSLTPRDVLPEGISMPRLAARYGRDLELWAWRAAPETLDAGGRLFLNVLWRARRAPAEDYQLVVNLADEAGRVWHTTTHPLTGVDYAPTRWRAGDLLAGAVAVDLPPDAPPGRHTVHLLVRGPQSGEFLWVGRGPWPWTGRALRAGAFTVR